MAGDAFDQALERRLPTSTPSGRGELAKAYRDGVAAHAIERTTGTGPVPSTLSAERAELLAHVSRNLGQLLSEVEIGALLRIPTTAAKSLRKTMLAVYDDLPLLSLKSAFIGAIRDGRGTAGEIKDGYRVKFASAEKLEIARAELARQGFLWELVTSSGSQHILLIDSRFSLDPVLPNKP